MRLKLLVYEALSYWSWKRCGFGVEWKQWHFASVEPSSVANTPPLPKTAQRPVGCLRPLGRLRTAKRLGVLDPRSEGELTIAPVVLFWTHACYRQFYSPQRAASAALVPLSNGTRLSVGP